MVDKIIFTFENLLQASMKSAGLRERQVVKRGTVREIWNSLLESWIIDKKEEDGLRSSEHLIQFSTRRFGSSNRRVLMWHETPADIDDVIYAYFPMSLYETTSRLTADASLPPLDSDRWIAAETTAAAPLPHQEKIKKE